jgi:aminoglycoside/choline kinase family phosphotransferase
MEYKIVEKISVGGSDRIFYRCKKQDTTFILVWDKEIESYLALHKHLYDRGINVPELLWVDDATHMLAMEDLGSGSLYELFKRKRNILPLYRSALNELIKIQIDGYFDVPIDKYYDYEHMKWEQEYFFKYFVGQLCRMPKAISKKVNKNLDRLPEEIMKLAEPWCNFLMHRDYQSKNIYLKKKSVKIIDFQSARIGPLTYDVVALLRDPYVKITRKAETTLIDYYLRQMKKRGVRCEKKEFWRLYRLTALQRHMQALGAYANLALNKSKPQFKQFIPRGLQFLLNEAKESKYNELYNLCINPKISDKCTLKSLTAS